MKANLSNLKEIWYLRSYLSLMEFWDEIWFFTHENWQRIQNMWHELTSEQFKESYKQYLETPIINTKTLTEIENNIYILLKEDNQKFHRIFHKVYLYDSVEKEIIERKIQVVTDRKHEDFWKPFVRLYNKKIYLPWHEKNTEKQTS